MEAVVGIQLVFVTERLVIAVSSLFKKDGKRNQLNHLNKIVFEVMTGDVIWFFLFYSESKLMNL
jgi:hypothetical protein